MGNFFLKIFFTPVVYVQNDQRVMGIILGYVCWGTHRPPPGSPAADRLTPLPPSLGRAKRKKHREREAHRARGLRLTSAVGGWWERADPNSLRTFDSHARQHSALIWFALQCSKAKH